MSDKPKFETLSTTEVAEIRKALTKAGPQPFSIRVRTLLERIMQSLHSIIIEYSAHVYITQSANAERLGAKYPWDGPIFNFQIQDGILVLQIIESLNDILDGAPERRFEHAPKGEKVLVLPTGEVHDFRGIDGDFGYVKATEVKNALTKLLHYQQNLAADPVPSIKEHILPLVLDLLGYVCSSYTFHTHDPEALDRSLASIGSPLYDPDDLKKYFQVHAMHMSIKIDQGRLCVDDSLPPRLVQQALHFNSFVGLLERSIDKLSMQDKQTHSRRIVRLLQEIIVEESGRIYNDQTFAMSHAEYVESGFDSLPDPCIAIEGDELTSTDPKTRYPIGWEEINDKLQQFALWQKALGDDPEMDLDIIKLHLIPLAHSILQDVCNFLKFLTLDMRSDHPEFRYAHLGIELKFGHLEGDTRVSKAARNKIGECNILLFKLSKEVDKLRLAQFGGMPATAPAPSMVQEVQLKSAVTTPAQRVKPTLTEEQSEPRAKAKKKSRVPSDTQKIIIRAINDGLSEDRLCEFLDLNKLPPRKSWLHEQMYTWPGSYSKAWNTKGKTANFWHRKINVYVQNIKRDFTDRIKVTKSPR